MKKWTIKDVAKHWDDTLDYDDINAKTHSYLRRFIDSAPLFSLPNNGNILDIDCRTGNGSVFFSKLYPTCSFTALAVSPTFEKIARNTFNVHKVKGKTGLFTSLPLPVEDSTFDVILTYETIEHMPEPDEFIKDLTRVLRKDGLLILTTPNIFWEPIHLLAPVLGLHHSEGPHRMLSRRRLRRILKNNSFLIKKERTFVLVPAGPKFLISIGKAIERFLPEWLLTVIALRQTFICQKKG